MGGWRKLNEMDSKRVVVHYYELVALLIDAVVS